MKGHECEIDSPIADRVEQLWREMQAGGWGGRGTFLPRKYCLVALAISEPLSDVGRRRHLADPPDLAEWVGDAVEPYGRRFVMPDFHRNGQF